MLTRCWHHHLSYQSTARFLGLGSKVSIKGDAASMVMLCSRRTVHVLTLWWNQAQPAKTSYLRTSGRCLHGSTKCFHFLHTQSLL